MRGSRSITALTRTLLAAAAAWGGVAMWTAAGEGDALRVTADNVNLRAGPGLNYEVVGQVSLGTDLPAAGEREGEWVPVKIPDAISLWVYGELVNEGVVAVSRLQVRGGPGINYKPVGRLDRGDRVAVRGKQGEWLKIAPPAGAVLWVSVEYIESRQPAPAETPARVASPPPAVRPAAPDRPSPSAAAPDRPVSSLPAGPPPVASPVVPRERRVRPPPAVGPPATHRLVASAEQGRSVTVSGVLRRAGWVWGRPSGYCLVREGGPGRRSAIVCYVLGDEARLFPLVGRNVRVRGRQYWLQGVRHPAVAPETISPF